MFTLRTEGSHASNHCREDHPRFVPCTTVPFNRCSSQSVQVQRVIVHFHVAREEICVDTVYPVRSTRNADWLCKKKCGRSTRFIHIPHLEIFGLCNKNTNKRLQKPTMNVNFIAHL
jgi:hypothetical protein